MFIFEVVWKSGDNLVAFEGQHLLENFKFELAFH